MAYNIWTVNGKNDNATFSTSYYFHLNRMTLCCSGIKADSGDNEDGELARARWGNIDQQCTHIQR